MSDAVTLARNAREYLSRGLSALQGDPNVPRHLLDLAAPIAQAMGALHQIERSAGSQLLPNAQAALASLQNALARLQAQPPQHPAVSAALESVATALAGVHALVRSSGAPPATSGAPGATSGAPGATSGALAAAAPAATSGAPAATQGVPITTSGAPTATSGAPLATSGAPMVPAPSFPLDTTAAADKRGPVVRVPTAPPAKLRAGQTEASDPFANTAPAHSPPTAAVRAEVVGVINAELGALSASNFYKGLSGNDIIDHGGLFVSTYKLPKIGQSVRLKVSLPGGYEFEANAVVRWRREASDAGSDAPPGFGAQFTEITAEARQLVYRYVRNREPLFHDDL